MVSEEMIIKRKLKEKFESKIREARNNYPDAFNWEENRDLFKINKSMQIRDEENNLVYSPKADLAVGPYFFRGGDGKVKHKFELLFEGVLRKAQIKSFIRKLKTKNKSPWPFEIGYNHNPRCLFVFELEKKTKDMKHIIGSVYNASALSKVGVLVVFDEIFDNVKKLLDYAKFCEDVGKMPFKIFRNIIVIKYSDLKSILNII